MANLEESGMCRWFRYKALSVSGDLDDPEPRDGVRATHCWCVKTQREFGPDDQLVDVDDCRPNRACYRRL